MGRFKVTNCDLKQGRKYKPHAFTEYGILMLSSVLNSDRAIDINIQIMKIFVHMRHYAFSQNTVGRAIFLFAISWKGTGDSTLLLQKRTEVGHVPGCPRKQPGVTPQTVSKVQKMTTTVI